MADQEQKLEFNFEMACDGCYNAAKRVLAKIGVEQEQVEADVPNHKLWVTSSKSAGQLVEALMKTGKKVLYVGPVAN